MVREPTANVGEAFLLRSENGTTGHPKAKARSGGEGAGAGAE